MDIGELSAQCRHCGWAFGRTESPFRRRAVGSVATEPAMLDKRRPGLPRPHAMQVFVDEASGAVELSFRAYRLTDVREAQWFIGLGLVVGITALLTLHGVVAVILGVVGALIMVLGTLAVVGRVRLRVAMRDLEIAYAGWQRRLAIQDLDQLFVDETQSRLGGAHFALKVRLLGDRPDITLVPRLESPIPALFLEQELERRLGIEDEPVSGEYQRRSSAITPS